IESKFGPEGSLYVLDWGGGFGRDNPNSGLHRIDYLSGSRPPVSKPVATPDSGIAPLEVTFDGTGSTDPEGEELTYAWDFDGDGQTDATGVRVTHEYTELGQFDVILRVTDPEGLFTLSTKQITVGNTAPEISVDVADGAIFN
ncbi:PKD domain-containing protein, partial [Streptomyces sp. SID13726]|uniref:PKD domain-containing protein n=1 Tax=Streptomyces sp. SID13726 TaxID=2706058 RepID=UPI0013BCDCD9